MTEHPPPPIEQVRGAVRFLQQSDLQRWIDAGESFDRVTELNRDARAIVLAHAAECVAKADREAAEEDRVERGMLASLCECCEAEIPEDSAYGHDPEHGVTMCVACCADSPPLPDSPDE